MKKRKKQKQPSQALRPDVQRPESQRGNSPSGRLSSLLIIVFLAGVVSLVYARSLSAPFVFDDVYTILKNDSITRLWPLWGTAIAPGPLNPPEQFPTAGRPLVNYSLAINYHFSKLDPAGYRAANLVLHVLSALLVWAILLRTLRLPYFGDRFDLSSGILALSAAILWALHPLSSETIVYVTQRTELMVGFFYLATLYCSLRYWALLSLPSGEGRGEGSRQDPHPSLSQRERVIWLALATVACLCGMASKEVMVTAPVVIFLFERTFVAGSFRKTWQQSWPLYCGLALGWLLLLGLNFDAPRGDSAGFHLGVLAHVWWFTQAKILLMYLKLVVWPWPLLIHYEMPYLDSLSAAWIYVVPVVLLVAGILIALWKNWAIGFVGAWVLLILSPTLVVPILTEMAAERRMYLPLTAIVATIVVGTYAIMQKAAIPRSVLVLGGTSLVLAAVFSSITIHRLAAFRDAITLWQDTLLHQPDNYIALSSLGEALTQVGQRQQAIECFERALQINPSYTAAHNNLGIVLAEAGQSEQAIEHYEIALQLNPKSPETHSNLGAQFVALGRIDEAIQHFEAALRLSPGYLNARMNLGLAKIKIGQFPEALTHFETALQLKPDFADAENYLGDVNYKMGRFPEAVAHYERAATLKPDYIEARVNLVDAYAKVNRQADAVAAARKAVVLAKSKKDTALVERIEAWIASYQAGLANPSDDN